MNIIISIDRNGLLCSSINLIDSLNNPTPFCTLSGLMILFHIRSIYSYFIYRSCFSLCYCQRDTNVVFSCHHFFYKVVFPFHANQTEKIGRNKCILAVIIFFSTSKIIIKNYHQIHRSSYTLTSCYSISFCGRL